MYIALARVGKEKRFIPVTDALPNHQYMCPSCHTPVKLIEDESHNKRFVHPEDSFCDQLTLYQDPDKNKEDYLHHWMKATVLNNILDHNPDHTDFYGLEYVIGSQRADAYVEIPIEGKLYKIAIECAYKSNTEKWDIQSKTIYYTQRGIHTLWIANFQDRIFTATEPIRISDQYHTLNGWYYRKVYGFYNNDLYSVHMDNKGCPKNCWTFCHEKIVGRGFEIRKPKENDTNTVDIVTFSDYNFWERSKWTQNT